MSSYRRRIPAPHLSCVGESDGAYDPSDPGPAGGSPLEGLAEAVGQLEEARRRVLDRFRDVTAWAGTAQTTGYTLEEWLQLQGRMAGRESWKYALLARRLPALPVTAALLECGGITFDHSSDPDTPTEVGVSALPGERQGQHWAAL